MRHDDMLESFKALDPIDGEALAERVSDEEWRQMSARITAAPKGRRFVWRRPVTRAGAFVVVTASLLAFASAIAGDRVIVVDAADALRSPAAVEARLAEEGIDAEVFAVPAKDDLVGKWFHLYLDPDASVDAGTFALLKSYVGEIDMGHESVERRCPLGDCERTSILEIPGEVKGPMTLVVGRAAGPGEEYWAKYMDWGNELAPSGAFYCLALEERSPQDAAEILETRGYRVEWDFSPPGNEPSRAVGDPLPGSGIVVAYMSEPDLVRLYTHAADEVERGRYVSGTPTAESGRPDYGNC